MIVMLLGLLFAPSAGRLFKHDSKLARSLCRGCAPADCCFHAMKPERLLRTCHAGFMCLYFHPRMRAACTAQLRATLLFCCVIVLHRSKTSALNLELRIYTSLGYFSKAG